MAQASFPFCLIIPGKPIITSFQQVDAKRFITTIPLKQQLQPHIQPQSQTQPQIQADFHFDCITLALLQPSLSPTDGIAVYLSFPPFQDFSYLGMVSNSYPSNTFHLSATHVATVKVNESVQIGLSIESLEHLNTLRTDETKQSNEAVDDANAIANNLLQYIQSWTSDPAFERAVKQWIQKFTQKQRLAPFFYRQPQV
jgi:hypothetical protein